MANIKNFGLSGISSDVQFGKAGGRVVYDSGNSVFKVTQSDGSTLDNIRVATPQVASDAATKAYVDAVAANASGDASTIQGELDLTQTGAGLLATGAYSANGDANYIAAATSLADADNKLDAALKAVDTAYKAADVTLQGNIDSEAATRLAADNAATTDRANIRAEFAAADSALSSDIGNVASDLSQAIIDLEAYADLAESDAIASAADYTDQEIAALDLLAQGYASDAETNAKAYTDAREIAITTAYQSYADTAEADAKAYTDAEITTLDGDLRTYIDTVAAGKDALSELVDVALTSSANGDLLMYNSTTSKWENVDVSTSMIDEGTNLYWTEARGDANFATNLAASTTSDLAEGTNLYFTDARAIAAVEGEASLDLTGNVTVAGTTTLADLVSIVSDVAANVGSNTVNVFQVVDSGANELLAVRENGDVSIGGILTVNGNGTSTFAGNVSIDGTINVAGDATFLANITGNTMEMSGDLTVNGDTLLTQTVTVKSDVDLANADANVNVFHVTDASGAELFEVRQNGDAIVGGTLTINGDGATVAGGLSAGDLTAANAAFTGNVSINGNLTVDGDSTFVGTISGNDMNLAGNLIIGDADTDYVTFNADVNSNIIPDANLTYDLGSATKKWNNIYVGTVNATTLIGSLTGQVSDISNHEGYIEGLFSVVDNGGDGSLTYANGVFTYTGPSAAEVRAHFTGGTGVEIVDGSVSIGQDVGTTANVTFNDVTVSGSLYSNDITASDVVVNGNLTVTGTTTTVNTETIELADNIIVFNSNATGAASQDAGIEIERGDDTNVTLLWDETNNRWTVGGEDFVAANFIGDLTGDVTGTVSSIANHTTDALTEGSVNLYYTDTRVAAYLTTNAYATEAYTDAKVADKDSFALRASLTGAGSIGTIVNVDGKTYYVSRIVVDVTTAFDAEVSISDGTNTLMGAAAIEEGVVGTYVAEMDFSTATAGGATISLATAATAGAATVTVEYVQL